MVERFQGEWSSSSSDMMLPFTAESSQLNHNSGCEKLSSEPSQQDVKMNGGSDPFLPPTWLLGAPPF